MQGLADFLKLPNDSACRAMIHSRVEKLRPFSYVWRPGCHNHAPDWMRRAVETITSARALCDGTPLSLLPNELLFEIFYYVTMWGVTELDVAPHGLRTASVTGSGF